jgi:hypothetical protein
VPTRVALEKQLIGHLQKSHFDKAKVMLQGHPELWPRLSALFPEKEYADDNVVAFIHNNCSPTLATARFIEWLIEHDPDRGAAIKHMGFAFAHPTLWDHPKALAIGQRYIAQGADVNFSNGPILPLMCTSDKDILALLLSNGADPNLLSGSKYNPTTPLVETLRDDPHEETFWQLVRHGGDVTLPQNAEVIHLAASKNLLDILHHCLEKGVSPNVMFGYEEVYSEPKHNRTPVEAVCYTGGELPSVLALMGHGGHYDPQEPHLNEAALKSLALDGAYQAGRFEKAATAYDRFIRQLNAIPGADFAKRIPRITRRNDESDAFLLTMNLAHRLACKISLCHPRFHNNGQHSLHGNYDFDRGDPSSLFLQWMARTHGSWASIYNTLKPYENDVLEVRDAVRHFTETVVLPEFYLQTRHRASLIDYQKACDLLLPHVAEVLFAGRTLPQTFDLTQAWHRKQPALDTLRTVLRAGQWMPLAPDYHKNDLTLTFLTTANDLASEGAKLKHCVGGYASSCIEGKTHIGSIRRDGERISTVELKEHHGNPNGLKIIQHRGFKDRLVERGSAEQRLVASFLGDITRKKIIPDFQAIEERRATLGKAKVSIEELVGHAVKPEEALESYQRAMFSGYLDIHSDKTLYAEETDSEERKKIRGTGKTLPLIPGGRTQWHSGSPKEFLESTGLSEVIKTLAADPPLSSLQDTPKRYRQ